MQQGTNEWQPDCDGTAGGKGRRRETGVTDRVRGLGGPRTGFGPPDIGGGPGATPAQPSLYRFATGQVLIPNSVYSGHEPSRPVRIGTMPM